MHIIISIIASIFAIFIVIVLHELGHFLVARSVGVKILKFSIGFGKALWSHKSKSGTEYVLAILPLGGYVKMLGEGDEIANEQDAAMAYNRKPLLARMAIVVAGPLTNFLLAILLFWIVLMMGVTHVKPVIGQVLPHSIASDAGIKAGDEIRKIDGKNTDTWQKVLAALVARVGDKNNMILTTVNNQTNAEKNHYLILNNWKINDRSPELFQSLGMQPFQPPIPPVIAKVLPDSPGDKSGLKAGDKIIAINGQSVVDWVPLVKVIRGAPNQKINLLIERDYQQQHIIVMSKAMKQQGKMIGYLGVLSAEPKWPPGMVQHLHYSFFSGWAPAIEQAWGIASFNIVVVIKMLTGKLSVHTLGGPITIFQSAGQASQIGLSAYLGFIGFISATIGFLNILPIPGLDGGHLFFQIIEGIFRRPVPQRIQIGCLWLGIMLLLLLMLEATINDIIRLFFT